MSITRTKNTAHVALFYILSILQAYIYMHQKFIVFALFLSLVGCGGGSSSSQPTTDTSQSTTGTSQPVPTSGQQPKPFNLLSIEASANKAKTFKFEWQESKGASSYTLCQKDSSKENDCLVLKGEIVSTSYEYTLDDLLSSQSSYFVIAKNSSGNMLSNERNIDEPALTAAVGFLKASDNEAQSNDIFGFAVTLSSDSNTLAIGSPGYQDHLGAVYIFSRQDAAWVQQQKLQAPDIHRYDSFGGTISLNSDGSTLAVGAQGDEKSSGAVYIFTRQDLTWTLKQKLKPSDLADYDSFGTSASFNSDGTTLAVGALNGESVYIFTRQGLTWAQQQKLKPSDISEDSSFGTSVSLNSDGSILAVGAPGAPLSDTSSVYIFTQQDTAWIQQQKLNPSEVSEKKHFGYSVNLNSDGSALAIGAPGSEDESGAVYLFTRQESAWTQDQEIKPTDIDQDDILEGSSISLNADGSVLAIGTTNMKKLDSGQRVISGAVYIFTRENSVWRQQQKFKTSDIGRNNTRGGTPVTLSADGKTLAAGAAFYQDGSGAVYLF